MGEDNDQFVSKDENVNQIGERLENLFFSCDYRVGLRLAKLLMRDFVIMTKQRFSGH